ncbi:MAG: coproporphyrinogen III oxidase family protein [Coriobacteriia bacterium]|nr:coproporphyrinogen III oxidase family protein [Coriobacteriia bacterium]
MLAERALGTIMRLAQKRYMSHGPVRLDALPEPRPGRRYVLYAHVPFCERLCPYCSFNRFLFEERRAREYFRRLRREMRMVADLGYEFASLYVGGGTPTVLREELVETISLARELFDIGEVSTETTPDHLDGRLIDALSESVDRLSVGVQSFDDGLLRQMDRYDKYGGGREIHDRIRAVADGFHSLNVDMIFNFPTQTEGILKRDVEMLRSSGANQTTFYPLMPSRQKAQAFAETVGPVDLEREARFYRIVCRELREEFEPASAWTFSKEAGGMIDEYIVDYDEYVGIGSGAVSYIDGRVYGNTFSLQEYARAIDSGRMSVKTAGRRYGKHSLMQYRFITDLFGLHLDKARFQRDFGVPVEVGLPVEMAFMRAAGAFERDDETITLTERGRYLLVVMMREVLTGSNDLRDQARQALPADEYAVLLGEQKPAVA